MSPKFDQRTEGWTGLSTRQTATGLPPLACPIFQDASVVGRDMVRRNGIARLGVYAPGEQKAMTLASASSQYATAPIDTRVWALGTKFSVRVLFDADTITGTRTLFFAGNTTPAMVLDTDGSSNWRWRVWDSAATLTTITVGAASLNVASILLTRDGAVLSARLDNGTAVTGAISATLSLRTPVGDLRIARDDGSNYFNGTIDHIDVLTTVLSDDSYRLLRLPNPTASYVRASYDFNADANRVIPDLSIYENHAEVFAVPTEVTSLAVNPAAHRGLAMYRDYENKKNLYASPGGVPYIAGIA